MIFTPRAWALWYGLAPMKAGRKLKFQKSKQREKQGTLFSHTFERLTTKENKAPNAQSTFTKDNKNKSSPETHEKTSRTCALAAAITDSQPRFLW